MTIRRVALPALAVLLLAGNPIAAETVMRNGTAIDAVGAPVVPVAEEGGRALDPIVVNGVPEFHLTAEVVRWHILPQLNLAAYAFNGRLPGPVIRVRAGDRFRVRFTNVLPEPTAIHWHGFVPVNAADAGPELMGRPVAPGETSIYELNADVPPGTYMYRAGIAADRQQPLGLYGVVVVEDPKVPPPAHDLVLVLAEHRVVNGETLVPCAIDGRPPTHFTINGKSFPAVSSLKARVGEPILLRLVGAGQSVFPVHLEGGAFEVVATDGTPVPAGQRMKKDTIMVGPGERYDLAWTPRAPGRWRLYSMIGRQTANGTDPPPGGITMVIDVSR